MRVFVTGATGFVGSAIVQELLSAGHQVVGLARSKEKAAALAATGADVVQGSLDDLDSLRRGAAQADGVIHTAFSHDFSRYAANCEDDRQAIMAMGEVLAGSDRPLLVTDGAALVASEGVATENDPHRPPSASLPRLSETTALLLACRGINAGVVRLPASTHAVGDHGFVRVLYDMARQTGVSGYVGDGANCWPAVHRLDAARVYRLALEKGVSGGPFHAVAEQSVPLRQIAEVIGQQLGVPTVSIAPEQAGAHFGWFSVFVGLHCPTSSERTRALLNWSPQQRGLLDDMQDPAYFGVR